MHLDEMALFFFFVKEWGSAIRPDSERCRRRASGHHSLPARFILQRKKRSTALPGPITTGWIIARHASEMKRLEMLGAVNYESIDDRALRHLRRETRKAHAAGSRKHRALHRQETAARTVAPIKAAGIPVHLIGGRRRRGAGCQARAINQAQAGWRRDNPASRPESGRSDRTSGCQAIQNCWAEDQNAPRATARRRRARKQGGGGGGGGADVAESAPVVALSPSIQ